MQMNLTYDEKITMDEIKGVPNASIIILTNLEELLEKMESSTLHI
jgi:hypothetical protein